MATPHTAGDGPRPSFEELVAAELAHRPGRFHPRHAPENQDWLYSTEDDLFGLAFSGGGIRSATFNLGLLQELDRLKLLPLFDYLATVSGGGYIGSFWTAWRYRQAQGGGTALPPPLHGPTQEPMPFFPQAGTDGSEPRAVRHLREFSNFLAPRLGLLTVDTGRMVVAGLSAVLPALVASLSLIVLLLLLDVSLAYGMLATTIAPGFSILVFAGLTLAVLAGFEAVWRDREHQEYLPFRPYAVLGTLALGIAVGLWWVILEVGPFGLDVLTAALIEPVYRGEAVVPELWKRPLGGAVEGAGPVYWFALFLPMLAWLGAAVVMGFGRFLFSRKSFAARSAVRPAFDRATSRLLLLAGLWALGVGVWCLGDYVAAGGLASLARLTGSASITGALFALAQKLLGSQPNKPLSSGLLTRLMTYVPQILAYLTILLLVLAMIGLILSVAAVDDPTGSGRPLAVLAAGAVLVIVFILVFFNPNRVGLHDFYRGRLARAFLGASLPDAADAPGQEAPYTSSSEEHPEDDVPLDVLRGVYGPTHLICCAANDLSPSEPLATLYRGACSAVLSPVSFSVGDASWHRWNDRLPAPTLGNAVTASGAAFNSHMGSFSMRLGRAVIFLMTTFNLRLGLWWAHPLRSQDSESLRYWFSKKLPGLAFFKELGGLSRADGGEVFLSDGAHFENLALYELCRRHCRYIIVSDCGADPDVAFDDFGNTVRRIREDFGVEIQIDLDPLRSKDGKKARQPMVAGDIVYPGGGRGVLLYFKPTLTGTEPPDVAQYKRRNEDFPHESTGDQFYDEAQWESYRRLGEHAARSAFETILAPFQQQDALSAADGKEIFADARRAWRAIPEGYEDRLSAFASRVADLDVLMQNECGTLFREVYSEIPDFDAPPPQGDGAAAPAPDGPRTTIYRHKRYVVEIRDGERRRRRSGTRRAETAVTGDGGPIPPLEPEKMATSLRLIRRILLLMEEVYLHENLEQQHTHPLYLGIINYFARWAYAPLFRMWWPLLRTLYPKSFTRFLEQQYKLAPPEQPGVQQTEHDYIDFVRGNTSGAREGLALYCWLADRNRSPGASLSEDHVNFFLNLDYLGKAWPVHVGLLRLDVIDSRATHPETGRPARIATWEKNDFYVPPGLWGAGIGQRFLRRLASPPAGIPGTSHLLVRLPLGDDATQAQKTAAATEMHMYRAAGFTDAHLIPAPDGDWILRSQNRNFVQIAPGPLAEQLASDYLMVFALTPSAPIP